MRYRQLYWHLGFIGAILFISFALTLLLPTLAVISSSQYSSASAQGSSPSVGLGYGGSNQQVVPQPKKPIKVTPTNAPSPIHPLPQNSEPPVVGAAGPVIKPGAETTHPSSVATPNPVTNVTCGQASEIIPMEVEGVKASDLQNGNHIVCNGAALHAGNDYCATGNKLFALMSWNEEEILPKNSALNNQKLCLKNHQKSGGASAPSDDNRSCPLNAMLPKSDIIPNMCDGLKNSITDIFKPIADIKDAKAAIGNILYSTPAEATYNNPGIREIWNAILKIVDAIVVIAAGWIGIRIMTRQSTMGYAEAIDMLPRFLLAILAAHFSLDLIQIIVEFNNALCSTIHQLYGSFSPDFNDNTSILFTLFLRLINYIMDFLLLIEGVVRLGIFVLLTVLSPVAIFCWFSPNTERFSRIWANWLLTVILMQILQVLFQAIGTHLIDNITLIGSAGFSLIAKLIIGAGLMYVTLIIPFQLRQWMTAPFTVLSRTENKAV